MWKIDWYHYVSETPWSIGYALRVLREEDNITEDQQRLILGIGDNANWLKLQGTIMPRLSSFIEDVLRIATNCKVANRQVFLEVLMFAGPIITRINFSEDGQDSITKDCWYL